MSLTYLDQAIMKGLLDILTEETVTVEVASSGDGAQDKYTLECVKLRLHTRYDKAMQMPTFLSLFS